MKTIRTFTLAALALCLHVGLGICREPLLGANVAQDPTKKEVHRSDPLQISLTILATNNTIVAKEPFFARLDITNPTKNDATIINGGCRGSTIYFSVNTSDGTKLFETPRPRYADALSFPTGIRAGETYSKTLILSGLYNFAKPGDYIIVVRRYEDSMEDIVLNENSARLKVLPYDAVQLKRRCDALAASMKREEGSEQLEVGFCAKALYSVQDNVVLPHLEWMVIAWDDTNAIKAAKRIGTPEAKAMVAKFANADGRVGHAVKDTQLDFSDWSWNIRMY